MGFQLSDHGSRQTDGSTAHLRLRGPEEELPPDLNRDLGDVRRVLVPYSKRMLKLLEDPDKFYTPKKRPSGHDISGQFAGSNGGSIPSNLLEIPNTESNSQLSSVDWSLARVRDFI